MNWLLQVSTEDLTDDTSAMNDNKPRDDQNTAMSPKQLMASRNVPIIIEQQESSEEITLQS